MTHQQKRTVLIVVVVVIVAALVWLKFGLLRPRTQPYTIKGTIVQLDTADRTATLEFIHPRTGQPAKLSGQVLPECVIRIDGQPATLEDARVGDTAIVKAQIAENKRAWASKVDIIRTTASTPASRSTTTPDR